MADVLFINDVDVDSAAGLGVKVGRSEGHRSSPLRRIPTAPILGREGHVELTDEATSGPRILTFDAVQVGDTVSDLTTKLEALKRLALNGLVRIRTGDYADREYLGRGAIDVGLIGPWLSTQAHTLRLEFTCADPLARGLSDLVVDFTGGATQVPLGTAPSKPVLRVGNVTNPTITYRNAAAGLISQMRLTITLGGAEWVDIDCENQTIVDDQGANQVGTLNVADNFISLNPYDATDVDGPWPTLEVSGGTLADCTYRKRYL